MTKVVITYGGKDCDGGDCESALSFNLYGQIVCDGSDESEKRLRESCFEALAIAHGTLLGLYNIHVKCVSFFEGGGMMDTRTMEYKTVYKVICWWDDDIDDRREMYVVAGNENEVDEKMQAHALDLKNKGYASLHWIKNYYEVEIDNVID